MTEQALRNNIIALRSAAEDLSEPEKSNALTEADLLDMRLEGMGLDQIADIMSGIATPDLEVLDAKIVAASDATKSEQERIQLVTGAIGAIKGFLGLP